MLDETTRPRRYTKRRATSFPPRFEINTKKLVGHNILTADLSDSRWAAQAIDITDVFVGSWIWKTLNSFTISTIQRSQPKASLICADVKCVVNPKFYMNEFRFLNALIEMFLLFYSNFCLAQFVFDGQTTGIPYHQVSAYLWQ